jgi:glycosyltransferase involved in cell wall biosynthesis
MYHGMVVRARGIERLIEAVGQTSGVVAVILGNGQPSYLATLKSIADDLGVADRVLFHPAVPVAELSDYVGAADVGVILSEAVSLSYYLSLPNKLFENIQSLTPVIGSDYPELSEIIGGYDIGLTVDPTDSALLASAFDRIRTDTGLRERFTVNLTAAKEDLCWEREQGILRESYRNLLHRGTAAHGQ